VEKGFDVADHVIAQQVKPGDLVITGDIPSPPGSSMPAARRSIPAARSTPGRPSRHGSGCATSWRSCALPASRPVARPFNAADKQRFANALDKWLVRGKLS
jgi:hypothetical protein